MNEEAEMTAEIVGGNVFEFTTEVANLKTSKSECIVDIIDGCEKFF
jgi:hypothetical protein